MAPPLKPRKFSFTMINTFEICPYKFHFAYVLYNKEPATAAMTHGNTVHKQFEDAFNGVKPDTPETAEWKYALAPIMQDAFVKAELQLGIDADGETCGYNAPGVYFRGKLDLITIPKSAAEAASGEKSPRRGVGYYIDWKTGNPDYPKFTQLDWSSLLLMARFPIERLASRLVYIGDRKSFAPPGNEWRVMDVSARNQAWEELQDATSEIRRAEQKQDFPKKQSALCTYCAVASCEHHGR